jgi:hypothetical protein
MELMVDQGMRLAHLSEAYMRLGDLDRARTLATQALETSQQYEQRAAVAWIQWILGEINSRGGDSGAAGACYRAAEALASELGMVPLLSVCGAGRGGSADESDSARPREMS